MNELTFIDELLLEAEEKEEANTLGYFDMLVLKASTLENSLYDLTEQAEAEIKLIKDWHARKTAQVENQLSFIKSKLNAFINEQGLKTLELPHGTLKLRKHPDKVVISDMKLFMEKATTELVTLIPEQLKPDLNKVKAFIKSSGVIPNGVEYITGETSFSISYIKMEDSNGKDKIRA